MSNAEKVFASFHIRADRTCRFARNVAIPCDMLSDVVVPNKLFSSKRPT